jgi:GNAT superfamily N-acetyltransferase
MTAANLTDPSRLTLDHHLDAFDCGTPSLDEWLKRYARRNEVSGASRTYVVCIGNQVVGYYCISTGAIARSAAPKPMQRNMPDPIPVVLLGRLAVDRSVQGQGIGSALLRDATLRVLGVAETIGIKAILVHAISDHGRHFYLDRGFLESPRNPMALCLMLDTARRTLAE